MLERSEDPLALRRSLDTHIWRQGPLLTGANNQDLRSCLLRHVQGLINFRF